MSYCPNCGEQVSEENDYCPSCGHELTSIEKGKEKKEKHEGPSESGSTKKKVGIGILALFIVIIIAGALAPSEEKEKTNLSQFSLEKEDGVNDFQDTEKIEKIPSYVDIKKVFLKNDNGILEVEIETGGNIPTSFDTTEWDQSYFVSLNIDEDWEAEYQLDVLIVKEGPSIAVWDADKGEEFAGEKYNCEYQIKRSKITFTIPLSELGNPSKLGWNIASEWGYFPEEAPVENAITAGDYTPDNRTDYFEITV